MEFMDRYKTLFSRIESLLSVKARVTVAIDGGAAAGKTTLAALLAERYGGEIVTGTFTAWDDAGLAYRV